ncbi:NAD(P)/FAD-dependent oxidoreductase [Actinomycetospora callitridis]|uniref:NAD(P)/FAD-dependent oxidoreductase n=1 Tax=Actinomycetospora callitridis TaxID=913944 RepID=UPI00236733A7|nr:FAD-dependent oxidoreductase [Actinomycetospora callitridis]MDD7918245.1 FAD-dependent oxidoreductase [Actinomycetospora callitridis]
MTYVIVGAGLAGARAAEALRDGGYEGRVVLLGAEQHRPYERPPLSKEYLQGSSERDEVFVHPADWYREHDVDLRLGATVTGIDRDASEVVLDDGGRVGYDALLLATGSSPRHLRVPGAELEDVHYLRYLDDSDRLKILLQRAGRIAVIGGGWIGLEVTAAARIAGVEVAVLEAADAPLLGVLGPEIAEVFAGLHREHGVDLRTGVQVTEIVGKDGAVVGVRLGDGSLVEADAVVVGIGAAPNTGLAEGAGLQVDDGVRVDEHLRSSDPHIYAAGDIASIHHPALGRQIRVEHWATAQNSGPVAAAAMIDENAAGWDRLPYFFTDQYDLGMEYTGHVDAGDEDVEVVVRGDLAGREFIAFWLRDGRLLAGMNVNIWDVTDDIERLIRAGTTLDTARLADPGVPLSDL